MCSLSGGQNCIIQHLVSSHSVGGRPVHRLREDSSLNLCTGAHLASCKVGTGSFPGVKYGRGVLPTTHPLLVPRSWMSRAVPLPTLWATPQACNGKTLPFYVYVCIYYVCVCVCIYIYIYMELAVELINQRSIYIVTYLTNKLINSIDQSFRS